MDLSFIISKSTGDYLAERIIEKTARRTLSGAESIKILRERTEGIRALYEKEGVTHGSDKFDF